MSENICKACEQPCAVTTIDIGIGSYEYWGASGYDSQVVPVSLCCEADFDGVEPEEPEFDEPVFEFEDSEPPF